MDDFVLAVETITACNWEVQLTPWPLTLNSFFATASGTEENRRQVNLQGLELRVFGPRGGR